MWSKIMKEHFGAKDPKSMLLRFHTQTGGSTLAAQQPEVNLIRVAIQALAAVMGGTQSLHTNGFDEALGLPTEKAAKLALRTQQVIAYESGVVDTADPLGGSYFVESLTNEVEAAAWDYLEQIEKIGGAVSAIEAGYMQDEIDKAAYEYTKDIDSKRKIVVGVNEFLDANPGDQEVFPIDPAQQLLQAKRVAKLKAERSAEPVTVALAELERVASEGGNLMYPMKKALAQRATLGEVADTLRKVFGTYQPTR